MDETFEVEENCFDGDARQRDKNNMKQIFEGRCTLKILNWEASLENYFEWKPMVEEREVLFRNWEASLENYYEGYCTSLVEEKLERIDEPERGIQNMSK